MSETKACSDFPQPQDFKEILELLEKLSESVQATKNAGPKLLQDVKKYCKETDQFYKDSSSSNYLWNVFSGAKSIRSTILDMARTSGTYKNLDNDHGKHEDCIAEALKKCLPNAYAALYFLLFMGSQDLERTLQGGKWKDYACDGTDSTYGGGSKVDLYLWLNDRKGENTGLVKRGFSGLTLTNKKGSEVATQIKNIIKHDTPEALQKVLSYLLFSCEWDPSLLGHALCFLYKFCEKVMVYQSSSLLQGKLKGEDPKVNFENLNAVCIELQGHLLPFTDTSDSKLSAVCHENSELFDKLWDDEHFEDYVKWLKENLKNIIGALEKMSSEYSTWDSPHSFSMGLTAGPFKYGFVFKASWQASTSKSKLQDCISKLIDSDSGSLQKFISFLFNPSTPSSAGATAGGVVTGLLGTGGLGAGAAYATNAFGFQNFITGLLSSFLK
ncbi:secreted antigen 3 [Babesia divergens]|uniref:Secreted antigen 3 n=1 Tax=Babesia divergens TaxID=32595 RepID=A0AAD9GCR0_BABDI|nr:secreted antigen 3 [Babesia divergens]